MTKWLYPIQEGSQLWDKITKQPAATRVHGTKTDDQARLVASAFAPQINHFHQGQAGIRATGGLPIYKSRSEPVPGLKLSYTYNHGLEYLDITVSPSLLKELLENPEDFWDYALVELVLPDGYFDDGALALICYAHMTAPVEAQLTDASVWPVGGVAGNRTRTGVDPIINAADAAAAFIGDPAVGGEMTAASFTVNLRRSRGSAATLDIYAYLSVPDELVPDPVYRTVNGLPDSSEAGSTTPADYITNMTDRTDGLAASGTLDGTYGTIAKIVNTLPSGAYDGWPGYSGRRLSFTYPATVGTVIAGDVIQFEPLPPTYFDRSLGVYLFNHTGTSFQTDSFGNQAVSIDFGGSEIIDNRFAWWLHWYVTNAIAYRPPFPGPAQIPAKVQITLFKGVPQLSASQYLHAKRWALPSGSLVGPTLSVDITVPAYSDATFPVPPGGRTNLLSHFYDVPKLGSVTIDTHRIIKPRPDIQTIASFKKA